MKPLMQFSALLVEPAISFADIDVTEAHSLTVSDVLQIDASGPVSPESLIDGGSASASYMSYLDGGNAIYAGRGDVNSIDFDLLTGGSASSQHDLVINGGSADHDAERIDGGNAWDYIYASGGSAYSHGLDAIDGGSPSSIGSDFIEGGGWPNTPIGGNLVSAPGDGYVYHTFTSSNDFIYDGPIPVEVLIVAGGGGGGTFGGGGGGGVEILEAVLQPGLTPAVVGFGGAVGSQGQNSSFAETIADGGGAGGDYSNADKDGQSGGSGGGGGTGSTNPWTPGVGGSATATYGNAGGTGDQPTVNAAAGGGGGGGAGSAGQNSPEDQGGDGGAGIEWPTGSGNYYAGGGGGGGYTDGGDGGVGGGGYGAHYLNNNGVDGEYGKGGGGGGSYAATGSPGSVSGKGGKGVVIVRYPAHFGQGTVSQLSGDIFDSFDRADNASTMGNAETSETWLTDAGKIWGISGETAYQPSQSLTGGPFYCNAVIETGQSDGTIELVTTVVPTGDGSGITFRYVDNDNFWAFVSSQVNGRVYLEKRVAGAWTVVSQPLASVSDGDELRVVLNGNDITCYHNGASVASTTDSQFNTATKHGIHNVLSGGGQGLNSRFDNFTFTNL